MRFNCQSCQAKYQIADEKVAGKTVRMKCRRCNALIQVRAQSTAAGLQPVYSETPTSRPGMPPPSRPGSPLSRPGAPLSRPGGPPPSRPGGPLPARPSGVLGRPSGLGPPRPSSPLAPLGRASSPGGVPRPTPSPGGPSNLRGPAPAGRPAARPQTGGSGPRPAFASSGGMGVAARAEARQPAEDDESTVVMERPVALMHDLLHQPAPEKPAEKPELPDWYVGIEGEPVGPVDVTFLKNQIDKGKVHAGSLVWREELTDWKPLRTFPELAKLVDQAPAREEEPLLETKPHESFAPPVPVPSSPVEPFSDSRLSGRDAVGPLATSAPPAASTTVSPFAQSAAPPESLPADSETLAELAGIPVDRRRKRRGMHPMAYAFIAMAAAFGAVAAWVIFSQKTEPSTTSANEPTAAQSAAAAPSAAPEGSAVQLTEVDISGGIPAPPAPGKGGKGGATEPDGKRVEGPKPCSPDDPFCGQSGVSGPSGRGPGQTGDGSGQGLTEAQVQSVVNRNRHAVSTKCMSFVSGKGGGSAKVGVTLVVAPSGAVQSVSASGGADYPGLAGCVKSRVANWSFPSSGASTTVNIPFHFVTQ